MKSSKRSGQGMGEWIWWALSAFSFQRLVTLPSHKKITHYTYQDTWGIPSLCATLLCHLQSPLKLDPKMEKWRKALLSFIAVKSHNSKNQVTLSFWYWIIWKRCLWKNKVQAYYRKQRFCTNRLLCMSLHSLLLTVPFVVNLVPTTVSTWCHNRLCHNL